MNKEKKTKSLLDRIDQTKLTKSQSMIADYITHNEKRAIGMTAMEIAKEVGVSDASVIRFCRSLGFAGFPELKQQLEKELAEKNEKIGKHSLHDRFVMQSEKYSINENTLRQMGKLMGINLETSLNQNSPEIYERVATRILEADRKMVIGLRGGKGCAINFSRLLGYMVDHVLTLTEENNDIILKMTELSEKDVVIFLNFPRYYKLDEKLGELICKQKVPCILITDSMNSPITKYAEEVILVETEHCGFFHSMLGVMGILEYLLILICYKYPEGFRERLKQRDAILAEYMINDGNL